MLIKFAPNVSRHIIKIQLREPEFNPRWNRLLSEFFIGILPNSYIYKIFDAYIIEGYKVPLRFALAHIALQQDNLLKCQTEAEFNDCLMNCFNRQADVANIWSDRDLNQVVSSPCETFRNPSFIENETGWSDIYCIEVYRFK